MVREAKPLTSIVPVDSNAPVQANALVQPVPRKGTLVLEVQDPAAIAALGEQLSLANERLVPTGEAMSPRSPRGRKRSSTKATTEKTATEETVAEKTTRRQTPPRQSRSPRSTVSKAKQKNPVEALLTVPVGSTTEQQMLDRVQQLSAAIAQLQSRLDQLHQTGEAETVLTELRQTQLPPTTPLPNTPAPRLPDWSEPELRPHYTLQESARIYAALEALHQHRTLQTPATQEMAAAQTVANQLRRSPNPTTGAARPLQSPSPRSINCPDRSTLASTNSAHSVAGRPTTYSGRPTDRRSRRRARWRWDAHQFWHNLQQLGQSLIPVPTEPGAKIVDVAAWVLAVMGLRLLLNLAMQVIPAVALPLNLLMTVPAILAAYLAFCVHNARSDVIYRLLLLTLGLFLGGRL